ncbi:hypothetical protein [Coprobacter sp.]
MKIDLYTKSVLTIIAICLIVLIFKNNEVIPTVKAAPATLEQLNGGVVDVRIVGVNYNTEIPVKIESVKSAIPIKGASSFDNAIPVSIENIKYSISNPLPVKIKN